MKQRIEQYVAEHQQELLDSIMELVRIDSTKGDPEPGKPYGPGPDQALQRALEVAERFGFRTTNYDGYVGTVDFSADETALDILAHLDIVPAPPEKWTVCQPFDPTIKDGKLYGRGSTDDKGPAMCALFAMKAVKDLGIPLQKNIRLILGTDEECGSSDIEYYYQKVSPAPATFSPDAGFPLINVEKGRFSASVCAEYPTPKEAHVVSIQCGVRPNVIPDSACATIVGLNEADLDNIIEKWSQVTGQTATVEKQQNQLILTTMGVGGHAASPDVANNALTGLLDLLARLPFPESEQFAAIRALSSLFAHNDWAGKAAGIAMSDKVSESLTISLNILQLSETKFSASFDSRTPICSTVENTVQALEKSAAAKGLSLQNIATNKPHYVPLDSPFIQTLLRVYEEYSGLPGYGTATGGGTYVHDLENGVAFGPSLPGTENNCHGADEFAVIDHLLLCQKIFTQVIAELCG